MAEKGTLVYLWDLEHTEWSMSTCVLWCRLWTLWLSPWPMEGLETKFNHKGGLPAMSDWSPLKTLGTKTWGDLPWLAVCGHYKTSLKWKIDTVCMAWLYMVKLDIFLHWEDIGSSFIEHSWALPYALLSWTDFNWCFFIIINHHHEYKNFGDTGSLSLIHDKVKGSPNNTGTTWVQLPQTRFPLI